MSALQFKSSEEATQFFDSIKFPTGINMAEWEKLNKEQKLKLWDEYMAKKKGRGGGRKK